MRIRHVSFRISSHEAAACDGSGTRGVIGRACRLLMEGENEAKRRMERIPFSLNELLHEQNISFEESMLCLLTDGMSQVDCCESWQGCVLSLTTD
ncbi:hypothetical protein LQV63_08595 [Paenibacillus profundus]|uniref:PPM-type phosphatase domain-containing protein n=1 Tax=Paenibacillus profundus TaxID=1173085 RepID=A0ABS8YBJ2_9BACL|nr:hypothetical protein [Paenibacillus profundus]MCE5169370.1 hypothetical protein [Paenibacillus profundus]